MPVIKPISDLRNYTEVTRDVSYGNRVYLTKNGHGDITMIDMHELDDIEKELALYKFKYEIKGIISQPYVGHYFGININVDEPLFLIEKEKIYY